MKMKKGLLLLLSFLLLCGLLCSCDLFEKKPSGGNEADSTELETGNPSETGISLESGDASEAETEYSGSDETADPSETDEASAESETGEASAESETGPESARFLGKMMDAKVAALNVRTAEHPESMLRDLTLLPEFTAGEILSLLESLTMPSVDFINGDPKDDALLEEFKKRRNLEVLQAMTPETVLENRYGILVHNTDIRRYPTTSKVTRNDTPAFDYFQDTKLYYATGVLVFHQSADRVWSFVVGENYYGWIQTENIAFCSEEAFLAYLCPEEVLIAERMTTEYAYPWERPGVILPLVAENETAFAAALPDRDENGNLVTKTTLFYKDNATFHEGFYPYSAELFIAKMREGIGMKYGWGDEGNGFDCSSSVCAVCRLFGIYLPRDSGIFRYCGGEVLDVSEKTAEEKFKLLEETPGAILWIPGHIMVSAGKGPLSEKAYSPAAAEISFPVIHNTTGFRPDENAEPAAPFAMVESDLYTMFYANPEKGKVIDAVKTIITFRDLEEETSFREIEE